MITSLRQHWPSRKMEWMNAFFLSSWGLYVLLHPELFSNPGTASLFGGMSAMVSDITDYPALVWGGVAFSASLVRAIALFVNGAYARTPVIRVATSFISMFIVTQIFFGLWQSGLPNTGLVVYPWFILADMLSAYRASVDAVHAAKHSQDMKDVYSRINSNSGASITA